VLAGVVGELHPSLVEAWELRGARVVVAEVSLTGLGGGIPADVTAEAPPRYQASDRDLAVVVREDVAAGDVAATIRSHAGPSLTALHLFDVYRGTPLADDERSLAFRLTFRAPDRTLAEAEIETAVGAITNGLATEVGGRIRT